jgi:predicted GIY-YIG superfamily endonuclease
MLIPKQYKFDIFLENCKISKIINSNTNEIVEKFTSPLTSKYYKIYIITNEKSIIYIGTTKNSIRSRIRSGLNANGNNGYYGYKWKHLKEITLSVWIFEKFNKEQIENIEAELAFIVRNKTKKWPDFQNEIHFNNAFSPTGEVIAKKIMGQLTL